MTPTPREFRRRDRGQMGVERVLVIVILVVLVVFLIGRLL